MAIEFDCPRCSATIRVPDAYSGRQGRCPQCNERLLVPLVAVPDLAGQAPAAPIVGGFAAPAAGMASAPVPAAPVVTAGQVPAEVASGALPAVPAVSTSPVLPGPSPAAALAPRTGRSRSTRFNRRRPSRALVIGIPVIGFLLLLAILALTIQTGPEMQGEIRGRLLAEKSLPRTVIPWSDTGVSADQQQLLQAALTENPETFSSELLVCRLLGTPAGLEVQLTAATGAAWCAVNPHEAGQKALAIWLKQHRVRLGEMRRALMTQTLSDWCQDKLRQINGEEIAIDAARARDNGVLNATVDSMGFAVQGRAGKRLVRTAAEDDAGWLYFCVPSDTDTLIVEGRSQEDASVIFPGRYEVTLEAPSAAAPAGGSKTEAAAKSAEDATATEESAMEESVAEPAMEEPAMESGSDSGATEEGGEMQQKDSFGSAMKGMFKSEMSDESADPPKKSKSES